MKKVTKNRRAIQTIERMETLYECMKAYGFEKYITFDLGALSKYNYYTGLTFRAYTYGTGNPVVTGGRYDSLVEQFGKKAPAIGFALSLDELMAAMSRQKISSAEMTERILILYETSEFRKAVTKATELREEKPIVYFV